MTRLVVHPGSARRIETAYQAKLAAPPKPTGCFDSYIQRLIALKVLPVNFFKLGGQPVEQKLSLLEKIAQNREDYLLLNWCLRIFHATSSTTTQVVTGAILVKRGVYELNELEPFLINSEDGVARASLFCIMHRLGGEFIERVKPGLVGYDDRAWKAAANYVIDYGQPADWLLMATKWHEPLLRVALAASLEPHSSEQWAALESVWQQQGLYLPISHIPIEKLAEHIFDPFSPFLGSIIDALINHQSERLIRNLQARLVSSGKEAAPWMKCLFKNCDTAPPAAVVEPSEVGEEIAGSPAYVLSRLWGLHRATVFNQAEPGHAWRNLTCTDTPGLFRSALKHRHYSVVNDNFFIKQNSGSAIALYLGTEAPFIFGGVYWLSCGQTLEITQARSFYASEMQYKLLLDNLPRFGEEGLLATLLDIRLNPLV
ncbi:MAG: hypothetical protein ABIE84_03170 [bacterium]